MPFVPALGAVGDAGTLGASLALGAAGAIGATGDLGATGALGVFFVVEGIPDFSPLASGLLSASFLALLTLGFLGNNTFGTFRCANKVEKENNEKS